MVADRTVYEAIPGLYDALPAELQSQVDRLRLPAWERTLDAMRTVLKHWRWSGRDIRAACGQLIVEGSQQPPGARLAAVAFSKGRRTASQA